MERDDLMDIASNSYSVMGRDRRRVLGGRGRMPGRALEVYRGPFAASFNGKDVTIGQGFIWCGVGFYDWQGGAYTFVSQTGTYYVCIKLMVNPYHGYFSASYKPTLAILQTAAGGFGTATNYSNGLIHVPICKAVVASGDVTYIEQRWQGCDILMTAFRERWWDTVDNSDVPWWVASLSTTTTQLPAVMGNDASPDTYTNWAATAAAEDEGGP